MSQFYHPDSSTQPAPVVKPEQWQAPQHLPPPETHYSQQPTIPPTQPAPPPRKRMPLDSKIAIGILTVIVLILILTVGIGVVVSNNTTASQANEDATTTAVASENLTATANANATAIAVANETLSNALTQTAMTPTAVPTTPTPTSDIGNTQQADVWSVTLNSVKEGLGDGYLPPKSGDIYLYFNVTAQNTDTSNHLISVIDFSVTDSDGNKYGFGADSNYQDLSGTVVASQKLRGWVIFEVAKSAHAFTLQFDPSFDPNQAVQWNVTV